MASLCKVHATCILLAAVTLSFAAPEPSGDFLRKVSVREVEFDLHSSLEGLLSGGGSEGTRLSMQRREAIEAATWQTFQALPKNDMGRLSPPAVRYIVHNYFAKEHGWLIKGLEPHGMLPNATELHDVAVLQDKAPAMVEALLEARQADRGLTLEGVTTMILALEQLIFDESVSLLEAAYYLNSLSAADEISETDLHRVLISYLVLFGQGSRANLTDREYHQAFVAAKPRHNLVEFEHDAVLNFEYARRNRANPFTVGPSGRYYSFETATQILGDIMVRYGRWQHTECQDMRAHLMELDWEQHGRVSLSDFYAQPKEAVYHFSESAGYLRRIGALDETTSSAPRVIIANYIAGPSNCIASSSYYSVCCLNECEHVMNELEHQVRGPVVSPERLLSIVGNLSSASMDAPRSLPSDFSERLKAIAALHGGEVPLHGRLFAQWLHFAFPYECPYPSLVESAGALTASEWLDNRSAASASAAEREFHMANSVAAARQIADTASALDQWSDIEVLPLQHNYGLSLVTACMRLALLITVVCFSLRSAQMVWQVAVRKAPGSDAKEKKDDDYLLPLRV